jgi:hypothetical protein
LEQFALLPLRGCGKDRKQSMPYQKAAKVAIGAAGVRKIIIVILHGGREMVEIEYQIVGKSTVPSSSHKCHWQKLFKEAVKTLGPGQVLRLVVSGGQTSSLWNAWNRFCLKINKKAIVRQKLQTSGDTVFWLWFDDIK